MADLTDKQEWQLNTNSAYQTGVGVGINLATASLVLPPFLFKDVMHLSDKQSIYGKITESPFNITFWYIVVSWACLALAILCGLLFYLTSAKFVKAVYHGPTIWSEDTWENLRDRAVEAMAFLFAVGLFCLFMFLVTYHP
jgi:hypothetical protein